MKTAIGENAAACARDCREPGQCLAWPGCSCPAVLPLGENGISSTDIKMIMASRAPSGPWMVGTSKPIALGFYERLSLLGVWVDFFDGKEWRRPVGRYGKAVEEAKTHAPGHGVICANQDLPWRARMVAGIALPPHAEIRYTLEELEACSGTAVWGGDRKAA